MDDELWYKTGDITPLLNIKPENTIVFDTETTGTKPLGNDEILQISIVDGNNAVLFSSYIKPAHRKSWPKAQEINGISPAMVKNAPVFEEIKSDIQAIFDKAELIVGYNVFFDYEFLYVQGIKAKESTYFFDVMQEFAPVGGKYDSYHEDFKWCTLSTCARKYKFKFQAHDALEDTRATRHCFYAMLNDTETEKYTGYLRVVEIYAESKAHREAMRKQKEFEEQQKLLEKHKQIEEQQTFPEEHNESKNTELDQQNKQKLIEHKELTEKQNVTTSKESVKTQVLNAIKKWFFFKR